MRYLVTGGAGFLGSHICDALVGRGDTVFCLDSLITGSLGNIRHLIKHPTFHFLKRDVLEPLDMDVDAIFHFASPAAPDKTMALGSLTLRSNIEGTQNLLDLNARLLFASSVRVLDTDSNGSYLIGKRTGEKLCLEYGACVARMGSVYGPRMSYNDSRVIPTFLRSAKERKKLLLIGDGKQIDSFCFVSDMIRGLLLLMDSGYKGVMELGSPEYVSILDLALLITDKSNIESISPKFLQTRGLPNIQKAETVLGWRPWVSLKDGIEIMKKAFFEENFNAIN